MMLMLQRGSGNDDSMTFKHWWGDLHWALDEYIASRYWIKKKQEKKWKRAHRARIKRMWQIWAFINRPRCQKQPAIGRRTKICSDLGMQFLEYEMVRASGQQSPLDILMEREENGL